MAIQLFVSIPLTYGITREKLVSQVVPRYEEVAHEAEKLLGKYCELNYTLDGLMRENIEEGRKEYMSDCFVEMKDADCAVFANDWQSSDECVRLHKIAEALDIRILELGTLDGD